ncbi:MAG: HAMP domain-containing sensor histidine kinase [Bacteroidota bacterium]|nr:HAMP domain-containing sensor histidine kinase [Bacteroidota bacterium]
MNTYHKKRWWKTLLLVGAVLITIFSFHYTNNLVDKIAHDERKKAELSSMAIKRLASTDVSDYEISFFNQVLTRNETVPIIITDEKGSVIATKNVRFEKGRQQEVAELIHNMGERHSPIEINIEGIKQFVYYDDSIILTRLRYFPLIQLSIITIFIFLGYLAFSSSRDAEQNLLWAGMSKETAHQLGTPISSLIAWTELLEANESNPLIVEELKKDTERLQHIANRFSKIGSSTELTPTDITEVLDRALDYLKIRTSTNVSFILNYNRETPIIIPLNSLLFEWVIENLCKNAVDAIAGKGTITVSVQENSKTVFIDITDSGKGIQKSKYKTIFKPGYTTKKRGWGLGLSLSKRIIKVYHRGKIFVRWSDLQKGTQMRIVLQKKK